MKGSLIIIAFFILGIAVGHLQLLPETLPYKGLSLYALCGLMFCVGISIGVDPKTLLSFRKLNPRLALLPLMTIAGTLTGCTVASFFLPNLHITECCAIGSGMGYYSLSTVIISQYKGAELGTIALLSNVMREITALIAAPLLLHLFGPLAPISVGGATTMDTTLPIISQTCGQKYVIISIFHGCITDFSVTFLVTLFCSL